MKGIPMKTWEVRALLDNRKTVTRRVVKDVSAGWEFLGIERRPYELRAKADGTEYPKGLDWPHAVFSAGDGFCDYPMRKAPYLPGDILYVRETWAESADGYSYRADNPDSDGWGWRPSIHMPREAARIFLRVTDGGVMRLQDSFFKHGSTIFSLLMEGLAVGKQCLECIHACGFPCCIDSESECGILDDVRSEFADLWDRPIKKADRALYGWEANPWVWVIEFERISREEAEDGLQRAD